MHYILFFKTLIIISFLMACTPSTSIESKEEQYLNNKEEEQGYSILIATPAIANYGLPFCEKRYCIEVEVFSFKSNDAWFNQQVEHMIADALRQQMGLKQKLSLQQGIDAFIKQSDEWETQDPTHLPNSMFVQPRIAQQKGPLALIQLNTQYEINGQEVAAQQFYAVLDRQQQRELRLYDIVRQDQRISFGLEIQQQYQVWKNRFDAKQQLSMPDKLYWANQDWFFDEQGIGIYYRSSDFKVNDHVEDFTIYLSVEQTEKWIKDEFVAKIR